VDDSYYPAWLDELIEAGRNMPRAGQDYNWATYNTWVTRVEHMLLDLLGSEHVYYLRFHGWAQATGGTVGMALAAALQHLDVIRDDLVKGRLVSFRSLVIADVFSDFLDMATELLEHGYKDPAASLVGAVLERGLRDIAKANGIEVRSRDDLTSLANRLAEKGAFNRLTQKTLNVWIAIRNHADHGEFDEYTLDDVRNMLAGVRTFLSQYEPR
jgi:hypothetical protein